MAQQSLQFLQKLDTLPAEVQFYCSSEISEMMLDEFSKRNKIDREILTNIFYEVFINDFDLDKIESIFRTYVHLKEDEFERAVNDFVGIVMLPIDRYFEKKSFESFLLKRKVDIKSFDRYKQKLVDAIEDEKIEMLDKNLEEVDKEFDEEAETRYIIDLFENDLNVLLRDNTNALDHVNTTLLFLLEKDRELQNILLRIVESSSQSLTKNKFVLNKKQAEPTIKNWLKDFIKINGTDNFSNVVLSKYITRSANAKILSDVEKKLVRKLLALYRNLKFFPESMRDVPIERWEIIPVERIARDTVRNSPLSTPKTEAEKEIDHLREEEEKYKASSLERAALEEEIDDKGHLEDLKAELGKYKEGSLERMALEEEVKRIEAKE